MPQKKVEKPVLLINETLIEYVNNFNFLCITINNNLKLDSHIKKIAHNIPKTTGIINKVKHCLPQHILKTMYNSHILPHTKWFGDTQCNAYSYFRKSSLYNVAK